MKKWLIYLLPLLLIFSSVASFYYTHLRMNQLISISRQMPLPAETDLTLREEIFNRPAAVDPLFSRVSLILFNGITESMLEQLNEAIKNNEQAVLNVASSKICWEPIGDVHFNYQVLLSGLSPLRSDDFLKIASRESDSLAQVVQDYEGLVYVTESLTEVYFPSETWKESTLSVLNIDEISWKDGTISEEEWISELTQFVLMQPPGTLIAITSLIPSPEGILSWKLETHFTSPLYIFAQANDEPDSSKENSESTEAIGAEIQSGKLDLIDPSRLTATLAYALGLPSPTGCMSLPIYELFLLNEEEHMRSMIFGAQTYLGNALYALTDLGIDETITSGYFFQYTELLDYAKNTSIVEMQRALNQMEEDYRDFLKNIKANANILPMIFGILLMALLIIVWLLFLPYFYRAYFFGIAWILMYLVSFYFIFQYFLQLPALPELTTRWVLSGYIWPLLVVALLMGLIITFIDGFVFNKSLKEVIKDLQAASGTLFVFLVIETIFFSLREGFLLGKIMPGFFFEALLLRNLTHLGFLPLVLALMTMIAVGIYGISVHMAKNKK